MSFYNTIIQPEVWGKVIFSQASVILSTGGVGLTACITDRGGLYPRGSASGGVCLWGVNIQREGGFYIKGGLHPDGICIQGRSASGGCYRQAPILLGYYGIQPTNRQYASYWNAFLLFDAIGAAMRGRRVRTPNDVLCNTVAYTNKYSICTHLMKTGKWGLSEC